MTYQPRKGDRASLALPEVTVTGADYSDGRIRVVYTSPAGSMYTIYVLPEHLTPIEPEYEPGTWYVGPDEDHIPHRRGADGTWYCPVVAHNMPDDHPTRPLRRMTVEGES